MSPHNNLEGGWRELTGNHRHGGRWRSMRNPGTGEPVDAAGFGWDQVYTDTDWVYDADASGDLNVEVVDTLDYSGSGGLEEAMSNASSDPTVIVFEVGGPIAPDQHTCRFNEDEVWVAGETAPWPGIQIIECRSRFYNSKIIASHISFLQGTEGIDEYDSTVDIDHESEDVLLDHCTAGWSTEENIGITRDSSPTDPGQPAAQRPSIINTIIGEGLHDTDFHDSLRARGMFSATEYTSQHCQMGNLYCHNVRRQPMMRCESVMCNNYVYNFAHNAGSGSGSGGNIINLAASSYENQDHSWWGLHYEPGPDTPSSYDRPLISYGGQVFYDDLVYDDDNRPLSDGDQTFLDDPPMVPPGFDPDEDVVPAEDVPAFVMANAGPRPADRSPYEEGLINDRVGDGQGGVIDSQNDVGGYPSETGSHSLSMPSSGIVDWIKTNYTAAVEGQ